MKNSRLSAPSQDDCTLGGYLGYISPTIWPASQDPLLPVWPPDMFAIVASVLNITGAYRRVLSPPAIRVDWRPQRPRRSWAEEMRRIGSDWRTVFIDDGSATQAPEQVSNWWSQLTTHRDCDLIAISHNDDICRLLFNLFAASDEACAGVGFMELDLEDGSKTSRSNRKQLRDFQFQARLVLERNRQSPYGTTLCNLVHPSRARVLPKMHTPRMGMTLRSLSLHLALCPADEVRVDWANAQSWWARSRLPMLSSAETKKSLNILLVPWPMELKPSDIRPVDRNLDGEAHRPQCLFAYQPTSKLTVNGRGVCDLVRELLADAEKIVGDKDIDGVILPELAVDMEEYKQLRRLSQEAGICLITGIRHTPESGYCANKLSICIPLPSDVEAERELQGHIQVTENVQSKHHRWLLDSAQIASYGLVSRLHPDSSWWEGIEVTPRELKCVAFANWLYVCAMICEDLARQDPMASLVRSLGPSLLIALLMDGPQLTARWPSRYATVLADDPGTSVLTLTSLGMVKLSHAMRTSGKDDVSRTIALWKDAQTGVVEIQLPSDAHGVVLCITNKRCVETSADGRRDQRNDTLLVLGGVHPVRLASTGSQPGN